MTAMKILRKNNDCYEDFKEYVCLRIKQIREESGHSLQSFANQCSPYVDEKLAPITPAKFYKIEQGEYPQLRVMEIIFMVCRGMDMNMEDFFMGLYEDFGYEE